MSTFIGTSLIWRSAAALNSSPGLSIRVRLLRSLPERYKIDIKVKPGSHQSEHARECSVGLLPVLVLIEAQ